MIILKNSMVLLHYFQSNDLVEIKNINIQIPDNELANGFLKEFSKGQELLALNFEVKEILSVQNTLVLHW